jgi:hypothetical protein
MESLQIILPASPKIAYILNNIIFSGKLTVSLLNGGFMNRVILVMLTIISGVSFIGAETISLKGAVKKTGGTAGIAGVKVGLAKVSGLSTTTATDGAFTLTGTTSSIISRNESIEPIQFIIKGNTIAFARTSNGASGSVTIFSSDGKIKSSIGLHDLSFGKQSVTLPKLSSGINIMQVIVGAESFTRTLVCVGNDLLVKNEIGNAKNGGKLILAKQSTAIAVDTLMAEKVGYLIKKVAIQKYAMDNIAITLDTNGGENPGACTREALQAIADKYVVAQKAGDPSQTPLASQVKYLQNNKTITAEKCICKTAMPIDFSQSFFDVDSCRILVEIISSTGGTPWVLVAWLKVETDKISEIDAMVTTTGDFQFNAKAYLNYTKTQDWGILTADQKITRQKLINGANAYLDDFTVPSIDTVPWGNPCERVEGGNMHITPDCKVGMPSSKSSAVNITNRRYAVDVDKGTVDVFCSFGGSMPDSHMFRLINGKIRLVHTLSVQNK